MKFEYGQSVIVSESAPKEYKPNCNGWVVGKRTADNEEIANEFKTSVGTGIFLIEFDDYPSGIEIPEIFLSLFIEKGV